MFQVFSAAHVHNFTVVHVFCYHTCRAVEIQAVVNLADVIRAVILLLSENKNCLKTRLS